MAVRGAVEQDGTFLDWERLSMADVLSWYNMPDTTTIIVPHSVLQRCLEFRQHISAALRDPLDRVRHLWDEVIEWWMCE